MIHSTTSSRRLSRIRPIVASLRNRRPLAGGGRRLRLEALEQRCVLADTGLYLDGVDNVGFGTTEAVSFSGVAAPLFELTVEAWVYRFSNRCETVISGNSTFSYNLGICNNRVEFRTNGTASPAVSTVNIPGGVWTHIAATWHAGGQQRVYLNGQLESSTAAGPLPSGTGSVIVGAKAQIQISGGPSAEMFQGALSNVRVWNVERSQEELQRTMYTLLEGPHNGLTVNAHLRSDFLNRANGSSGTPQGDAALGPFNPPSPPQFAAAQVDANFNSLKIGGIVTNRQMMGSAYLPTTNRALLVGGLVDGNITGQVLTMDMSSGNSSFFANLPAARVLAPVVYAPTTDQVYLFGGGTNASLTGASDQIFKIDPNTGATSTLTTRLPVISVGASAVYHERLKKIVILGGSNLSTAQSAIYLFDPVTETITTMPTGLPEGRGNVGIAYSPVADKVYLFAGVTPTGNGGTTSVLEITFNADGTAATTQVVAGAILAANASTIGTAVDPKTQLIHLIDGFGENDYVQTFDPISRQLYKTQLRLPRSPVGPNGWSEGNRLNRPFSSVIYSPLDRHALDVGGQGTGAGDSHIWRIPLGDGVALPLEVWDYPTPVGATVTAINGSGPDVYIGTQTIGLVAIDENGTRTTLNPFGLYSFVNDVAVFPARGDLYIASPTGGVARIRNGDLTIFNASHFGTNKVQAVDPVSQAYGTDQGGFVRSILSSTSFDQFFDEANADYTHVRGIATDPVGGNVWGFTQATNSVDAGSGPYNLKRMTYSPALFPVDTNFGNVCNPTNDSTGIQIYRDMVFDKAGNLWIVGAGSDGGNMICYIPSAKVQNGNFVNINRFSSFNGVFANDVDVDGDGRVWTALSGSEIPVMSGGLTVHESKGPTTVTTTDYNWRNAPIGTNEIRDADGTSQTKAWDSGFRVVGAVDEKVWAGRDTGQLVTVAQRWQHVNQLANVSVRNLFAVRGRMFFTDSTSLYVLQPDGVTVDTRLLIFPRTVFGDSRGTVLVGVSGGIQQYTSTGWADLSGIAGTRPTGDINAIVEAADDNPNDANPGPIWIGGSAGLTLYDRNRYVATLTSANSPLPSTQVNALLADPTNRLWVGTDQGLAVLSADHSTWQVYNTSNAGIWSNSIFNLAELGDGRIAVSNAAGLSIYNGQSFTPQTDLPIPAANLPLTVDELGRLWAGSAVLTANGWQGYWSTNSGLRHSNISDNAADHADRVWFSHFPNPGVSVRGAFLPPLKDVQPVISNVSPNDFSAGTNITITGGGFGGSVDELRVTIGNSPVQIVSVTDTTLVVRAGARTTTGPLTVTRTGRSASTANLCAVPVIVSFTPTGGNAGMEVDFFGTNIDRNAQVFIGNQPVIGEFVESPQHVSFIVGSQVPLGQHALRVENACVGREDSADGQFRNIAMELKDVVLNQGMSAYGLIEDKLTLAQAFIGPTGLLSAGERLEYDEIRYDITELLNGSVYSFGTSYATGQKPKNSAAPLSPEIYGNTDNSENIWKLKFRDPGPLQVKTSIFRRGRLIDEFTKNVTVSKNYVTRVLLVPTMRSGSSAAELDAMKRNLDGALGELRERLLPWSTVEVEWSPEVHYTNSTVALDDTFTFLNEAFRLDSARTHWNATAGRPDADIAMGVVDPRLVTGDRTGFAFWSDVTEMINDVALSHLDSYCEFVDDVLSEFSLTSGEGCDIEIPAQVGWVRGGPVAGDNRAADGRVSPGSTGFGDINRDGVVSPAIDRNMDGNIDTLEFLDSFNSTAVVNDHLAGYNKRIAMTIAHEIGHIMGLVKPYAYNGNTFDNISHSVNDEIQGSATCGDQNLIFEYDKTLAAQPGMIQPLVNPLVGRQIDEIGDQNIRSPRGKAIMSYACVALSENSFFEPPDLLAVDPLLALQLSAVSVNGASGSPNADQRPSGSPRLSPSGSPSPIPHPGPRVHVAGTINSVVGTGDIQFVRTLGGESKLSLSYDTGYWLVQLDASGAELDRIGIRPVGVVEGNASQQAAFTASMVRKTGVARIELRHNNTVLDTFSAGAAAPVVAITSPLAGQNYTSGNVPISFTATDLNGDALTVNVAYSADNGVSWTQIGTATGSTTIQVPVSILAGAAGTARIRISATDGFNFTSATSGLFSVATQAPRPFIEDGLVPIASLEGESIVLSGGARDNRDGMLTGTSLRWTSNRDGLLGTGDIISAQLLTVGTHTITLTATNSAGLVATTTRQVIVAPDYDYDGIGDAQELTLLLNPLNTADAYTDADGDGLSNLAEVNHGTNIRSGDTDGDGRTDAQEFLQRTSGTSPDAPPAPIVPLAVSPTTISLTAELARDVPLVMQTLSIVTSQTTPWSITANVDWLEANVTSGVGTANVLLRAQAYERPDGVYSGTLTVTQGTTQVAIPVTLTVIGRSAYFDVTQNGQTSAADCAIIQTHVGASTGDPGYVRRYDIDRDGVIESIDVGQCNAALSLRGDTDLDNDIDAADIDRLFAAIRNNETGARFDLTADGVVNSLDVDELVEGILHTNYGDANLDGQVNRTDAATVARNLGRSGGWANGNFNADLTINLVDAALPQLHLGAAGSSPASPAPAIANAPTAHTSAILKRISAPRDHSPSPTSVQTTAAANRLTARRQVRRAPSLVDRIHAQDTTSTS